MRNALLEFADDRPPVLSHPRSVFLHFSRNQMARRDDAPFPLPNGIPARMTEHLIRTGELTLQDFLRLWRCRYSARPRARKELLATFRHEITMLSRLIDHLDLPILCTRTATGVRAQRDTRTLMTNVDVGSDLANDAVAHLEGSDWTRAARLAEEALAADFDCAAAAWVIGQVASREPSAVPESAVLRAQVCLARTMVRCTATARRLRGSLDVEEVAAARAADERLFERANVVWKQLLSRPFHRHAADRGDREVEGVRGFVQAWVAGFCDDAPEFGCFADEPVVVGLVKHLLDKRMKEEGSRRRAEAARNLRQEIFERLYLNNWLPLPAMSPTELRRELINFLGRRIDWGAV